MMKNHPYHLVDSSPWPLTNSIGLLTLTMGLIKWFSKNQMNLFLMGYLIIIITSYQWWRDVNRESMFQGNHTMIVLKGLKWGMMLFIVSEVLFFMSFFWAFFHASLSPDINIGLNWPPLNIKPFNTFQIPLLNTIILISSGLTVTWAHNSLLENNFSQTFQGMLFTILLGMFFSFIQIYEYLEASFTISDSIYGSTFFMLTGFHGLHVLIGTMFLMTCLYRLHKNYFSMNHHFGFEAASWYWHFVDVVWLFLFISIYWWSNN